jgi:hypothetical protein
MALSWEVLPRELNDQIEPVSFELGPDFGSIIDAERRIAGFLRGLLELMGWVSMQALVIDLM